MVMQEDLQNIQFQLAEIQEKNQIKLLIELQTEISSKTFGSAANYTNVIILAGYASLFTLWNFTKSIVTDGASIIIAMMIIISVMLFVTFEVYKMVLYALQARASGITTEDGGSLEDVVERLQKFQTNMYKQNVLLYKIWPTFLIPTIFFGYGAALMLFFNLIKNL